MNVKQIRNIAAVAEAAPSYGVIDAGVTLDQIGRGNVLAISGGRAVDAGNSVILPVSAGYYVAVSLDANDTYTVRRVFVRAGRASVKAEWTDIYCDQVGEIAYRASCFRD